MGNNWGFYNSIYRATMGFESQPGVHYYLENGYDPNYCRGEVGWCDSNPLSVVSESSYIAYYRIKRGEEIPDPPPDVAILQLLIEYGADINRRPYVWESVCANNNRWVRSLKRDHERGTKTFEEMQDEIDSYVEGANRLLEAFLKAGADPDKLGHPHPFRLDQPYSFMGELLYRMNDKKAEKYFAQGTRAINEAIKKGMVWESQVDLLLQYTTLDEKSLEAAEESNDSAMIEKINTLWRSRSVNKIEEEA